MLVSAGIRPHLLGPAHNFLAEARDLVLRVLCALVDHAFEPYPDLATCIKEQVGSSCI